ncbi:DUF2500 domain-containing protein [Paenibacillus sp. FSL H7-689]|uniref:DUF2500 domain-containing protein n=1 Tax=Paenibacillus sp. FSL H7-689 TaxID=1227349 RepID=UPI0003E24447|nr:DUF2500 domain-containing protein [Paenibacillus sp. FSL H7-689]ETT52882.1 hypothetical protein C170_09685 [Paenibacillus sp. FSL H7-689]
MALTSVSSSMGRLSVDGFGVFDDMNGVPGFKGNQGGFFSGFSEFAAMNAFASIFIGAIFLIIAGVIVFVIFSGIRSGMSNNAAALLTLHSTVVAKRTEVSGGSGDSSATTRYYVTFEFDNGERTELIVGGNHYGMMVENDRGMLTYQGTRFKHFERDVQPQSGVSKGQFYT